MVVEKVAEALDLDLDKLDTVEVRGFDGRVVGNHLATDSLWVSVPPFDPARLPEVVIVPDNARNYQAIVGMDYLEHIKIAIRHGTRPQTLRSRPIHKIPDRPSPGWPSAIVPAVRRPQTL